jgi:hypothetical protein
MKKVAHTPVSQPKPKGYGVKSGTHSVKGGQRKRVSASTGKKG